MKDQISHWYGIVSLNPDIELLEQRQMLLQHWTDKIKDSPREELLLEAVSTLFIDVDSDSDLIPYLNTGLDSDTVSPIVNFAKNKKEVRVLLGLALGESLLAEDFQFDEIITLLSLLVLSSLSILGSSTRSAQRYFDMLIELGDLARKALHRLSTSTRGDFSEKEEELAEIRDQIENASVLVSEPENISKVLMSPLKKGL